MAIRRPRRVTAVVLVCAVVSAAGCAPTPQTTRYEPTCAWEISAIGSQIGPNSPTNIVFPDTSANYWISSVPMSPTTELTISGDEIDARYWSIQTYSASNFFGSTIDSRRDDQIDTEPDGSWSVTVTPRGDDDAMQGLLDGQAAGYAVVMFRTYLSADASQPAGAAELPEITITDTWGTRALPSCPQPELGPTPDPSANLTAGAAPGDPPVTNSFRRTVPAATPFPNGDSAYLASAGLRRDGRVVVIRGAAPTVPDEMRYWSWCQFGLPSTRTVACLADHEIPLDADGWYTIVISDPRDRPDNATFADGVGWLPWGSEVLGAFALRNLVPDEDFTFGIANVPPNGIATTAHMGEYLPTAKWCSTDAVETLGTHAC